jgi:uncharacterized protein YwgA
MAQNKLLPLALLYVDGQREIDGATKFQKLVFLSQEETDVGSPFEYQADKYGPFSPELHATLDDLEDRGLIKKEIRSNRSGNEKYVYHLTSAGSTVIKKLMDRDDAEGLEDVLDDAQEIKKKHANKPLDRILKYVYTKYPAYTENTELDEFKPT